MATTNIELDIENITGVSDADDQFIVSAQKFVVASVPKNLLKFAQTVSSASTDGGAISYTRNDSIIDVQRNGYSCKEIPFSESIWATTSGSLKKATNSFPVYWHQNDGVKIAPATSGSGGGYVFYVSSSKLDDDSDLRNAVIYRAASNEFTKLATDSVPTWSSPAIPIAPPTPDFGDDLTISAPKPIIPQSPSFTYSDVSVSDIIKPLVSISDMASMDVSAPSYTRPIVSLTAFPTLAWTFPDVPAVPVIKSNTISFSQTAPTFTAPIMSAPDFVDANTWINTEEDSEMLSSRIQTIQAQIGEYSSRIQESQAQFNKENAEYQAQLQISLQNAQLESQDDAQKLQKHTADVSAYQSEVNKVIQGNQGQITEWQTENSLRLQQYGSDIQIELNVFNKENAEYQQDIQRKVQNLQKDTQQAIQNAQNDFNTTKSNLDKDVQAALQNAIQNFQKEVQEYSSKIERYAADVGGYQQEIGKEVQDYTNTLQKSSQEYQNKLALFTSDLQKVQNEISEKTQEAAVKVQNAQHYSKEAEKYYVWSQNEITAYIQNNSKMIGQTVAAQAAQQEQRR